MVTTNKQYSYDILLSDIADLQQRYPNCLHRSILGKSVLGRDIPLLTLGKPSAKTVIWIDAGIHAREYMSCQIVMLALEYLLQRENGEVWPYNTSNTYIWQNGQMRLREASKEAACPPDTGVCFYIAPMLNPDGVELARFGLDSVADRSRHNALLRMNDQRRDFTYWKANINGVDLNSNFPAYWQQKDTGVTSPGPQGYKGPFPVSEAETKSIVAFLQHRMDKSISYHAQGAEIYWYFRQEEPYLTRNLQFGETLQGLTQYALMPREDSLSGAGLRDYQIYNYKRLGLTVEIGPASTNAPMPLSDLPAINGRNKKTLWYLWHHS
ncbi:hypothetical protein LJB83_02420 [Clostridia bacterium OttesenSCG-928-F22]|nr:hypothetical protein [Clostridia bacterium OttesenSCG-928-F22]